MGKGVRLSGGYVDLGTVAKLNPYAFKHKDTQPEPAKKKKRKPRRKKSSKKTSGAAMRAKQPPQASGSPSPPAYWSSTAGGHPMGAVPKSAMKCSNCANLGFPCCAHRGFQICSNWVGKRKRAKTWGEVLKEEPAISTATRTKQHMKMADKPSSKSRSPSPAPLTRAY